MNDDDYFFNPYKKKDGREIKDPIQSFRDTMSKVALELDLTQDDISFMKQKLSGVDNVGLKNPTAYVLGYLATNKGKTKALKKEIVTMVFKRYMNSIEDVSVKEPDIVRYARLWTKLV